MTMTRMEKLMALRRLGISTRKVRAGCGVQFCHEDPQGNRFVKHACRSCKDAYWGD